MEFNITSTCRKCGRKFSTLKRYNDFLSRWELDSDSCEECAQRPAKHIAEVSPMVDMD
ncbi:MAG TPA: hypothetical protein VMC84_05655 [Methanocella sp.]|uniref:hypothetical protein n=1 Tax=Methanocella sp. TaxID=2052833 RepID=UPI002D01491B|nr:hypothetical protein [Methanocella sp.]HTY90645.1 hypothetical protein [Methanocella sp.]